MSESAAFTVVKNDKVGRYVVANRDLEAGEEIISVSPFVIGPKSSSYSVCLSCYAPWPPSEDTQPLCSKCGWPVCGEECENLSQHRDYECQVFSACGEKFNVQAALGETSANGVAQFECITPLRLLLQSEKNPENWNANVKDLEAHNKARGLREQWKTDHVNIVNYLRDRLKLERFSEELIQTVCGILEINAHEVRTNCGDFTARALYPAACMFNHNCVPNTIYSISSQDYKIYMRTRIRVSKKDELFINYTATFLPTILRRELLLQSKYFSCACPRCSDPTELGTNLSSLKCSKCDNGIVVPLDSLDSESSWKCTHCEFSTSSHAIRKVFGIIQSEVDAAESISGAVGPEAIHARESVIKKYHSVLHPRHAFFVALKYSLCQLYGRVQEYELDDLPDVVLEHKVDMCKLVLQVLDVIEPGYSRTRGMILYELHAPLLFLARTQWTAGVIDNATLKSKMIESSTILKEALTIFDFELPDSIEGQIAAAGKISLAQLEESIKDL